MRKAVFILAVALGLVATAVAGTGSRQEATVSFTTAHPGKSSGLVDEIDYVNPSDAAAKPPAVRRVVIALARGSRIDTRGAELCTASDAELTALGPAACPAHSIVGSGVVTVDTGLPAALRFVTADVTFLNNDHQLIFVNEVRGTSARTIIRAQVSRRKIVTDAGMLPGTPPDGGAIDTVHIEIAAVSRKVDGSRVRYITTPHRCPADGTWTNRVRFTYADGIAQTTRNDAECRGAGR